MTSSTTSPRAADGRNMVATTLFCVSTFLAPLAVHTQPLSGDGYLFRQPRASFTLRGGYSQPAATGDVFSHAIRNLTLGRSDFGALNVTGDVGIRLLSRLSLQFTGGFSESNADSEMRYWIDNNDQPITQTTTVIRAPLMAGLRLDLTSPGRSVGKLAYIPSRITPYISGGVGSMYYKFRQVGSFKDDNSLDVLDLTLETTGRSFASYGAIGADISLMPTLAFTTEARYESSHARPSGYSFGDFDRLDLSGVTATVGLTFRY
ncbi:MAG: hypothetical protein ABJB74_18085 [Gemmatimonas sp.]